MSEEQKQFSPTGSDFVYVSPFSSPSPTTQFPSFAPFSTQFPNFPSSPPPANMSAVNNTTPTAANGAHNLQPPVNGQNGTAGQQPSVEDRLNEQAAFMNQLNDNVTNLMVFIQEQANLQQQFQAQFMNQSQSSPSANGTQSPLPNPYANVTQRQSLASTHVMTPGLNITGTPSVNPLKHAKIEAPEKFHGKPGTTAAELTRWLTSMEIYMKVLGLSDTTEASLDLAMTRLAGGALNSVVTRSTIEDREIAAGTRTTGRSLVDWKTLKAFLQTEYVAESQIRISRNKLMNTLKYTGSIVKYNGEFYDELIQVPEFNDPVNNDLVMSLYANGIATGRGPHIVVYSRRIETLLQNKEVKNLHELMNKMKQTENTEQLLATSNRTGDRVGITKAAAYTKSYSGGNRVGSGAGGNPGRWSSNWRSPVRTASPGFQTPARVNNIEVEDERKYSDHMVEDGEHENGDQSAKDVAACHVDAGAGDDPESAVDQHTGYENDSGDAISDDDVFLHAIKVYDRMKKQNPGLTPEELDRRRRFGACFSCNQTGHYSRDCPKVKTGTGPNAFKFMGQKKE